MSIEIKKTARTRALFFFAVDLILFALSLWLAFLLRFEGSIPTKYTSEFYVILPTFVIVKVILLYLYGMYHVSWKYVSIDEIVSLLTALLVSSFVVGSILYFLRFQPFYDGFPRSILFIDFFISVLLVSGFRYSKRVYNQYFRNLPVTGKRTLIVGAGDAGEQIVRNIMRSGGNGFNPVGFVDDNPQKIGTKIHGITVLGSRKEIPEIVSNDYVEAILIAMPTVSSHVIKDTVDLARKAGVEDIKILPDISELMTGEVGLSDARDLRLVDLLGRESIGIKPENLVDFLRNKRVLITGAAGTIGSELCRQIAKLSPEKMLLLDHEETALFEIKNEIERDFQGISSGDYLADVRNEKRMKEIFSQNSPEIVFHAAAYKHVGMMEKHPKQSLSVNVFGTRSVVKAATETGVERFVLISTDKAVDPTSTMGASKRMAEAIVQDYAASDEIETIFTAVRFGNVLGSRGSVVKIFQRQIQNLGPVTVTSPDAERYFMIPSEAVLLVLQAAKMAKGGEVFVLDMGEPVKIDDLAREMIRLAGYEPDDDIPISYIGLKQGEKVSEDLLNAEEGTEPAGHDKIFKAKGPSKFTSEGLSKILDDLEELMETGKCGDVKDYFATLFDSYKLRNEN